MNMKMIRAIGIVTTLVALTLFSRPADANDCRRVLGKLTAQLVECMESPIGLCAEAKIRGAGPIRGSYFFTPQEAAPGAGLPSLIPDDPAKATQFSLVDPDVVLKTRHGDLVMEKLALFDVVTGQSVAQYKIHTGAFTGALVASAFFDREGTARGTIWGRVCKND